ncbi:MAG: XRE family transcriptional regulator [Azospirillaceae bacterium]|nr:XRE family transcriptional regulator [Azospirillaceae bacterium]
MELLRRTEPDRGHLDGRLAMNLRQLRRERGLTLDALALCCGVSRAMISKIERGTAVPTATVLGKLAAGMGVGLSQLVGDQRTRAPVLLPPASQPLFRDPDTGFERRSLSPLFPDRFVDFAFNTLPARAVAAFPPHHRGIEEYLFVSSGQLVVVVNGERFIVGQGSSLFYHGHYTHEFHNETDDPVEFYIVVDGTGAR